MELSVLLPGLKSEVASTVSPSVQSESFSYGSITNVNTTFDSSFVDISVGDRSENDISHIDLESESGSPNKNSERKGELTLVFFIVMIFILTCGGPFGIELAMASGGPLYTILGVTLIPFLYSIPQCLMTSELSSLFPSNHGSIKWVKEGLGSTAQYVYAGNDIVSAVIELPAFIVLAAEYIHSISGNAMQTWHLYLIKITLVLLAGVINARSVKILGRTTLIIAIVAMIPFLIGIVTVFPYIDLKTWGNTKPRSESGDYDWILFFSALIWLHTGWDSISNLAGEVSFQSNRYMRGFMIGNLLNWVTYITAIVVALAVISSPHFAINNPLLKEGSLVNIYHSIWAPLGVAVTISGCISNFSIYLVELSTTSRELWANSQADDYKLLPLWFGYESPKTGAPIHAIVVITAINCVLVAVNFSILIQMSVCLNLIAFLFEFAAFLRLRYKVESNARPLTIPGGLYGAWLLTMSQFVFILAFICGLAISRPNIFALALVYNIVLILFYAVRYYCNFPDVGLSIDKVWRSLCYALCNLIGWTNRVIIAIPASHNNSGRDDETKPFLNENQSNLMALEALTQICNEKSVNVLCENEKYEWMVSGFNGSDSISDDTDDDASFNLDYSTQYSPLSSIDDNRL